VAVVVAVAVIGGEVAALSLHGSPSGQGKQGAGGGPDLQAGPGQYYYWKDVLVSPDGNVTEQIWWAEDGSGRYEGHSENPNYDTPDNKTWGPGGFPEADHSNLSTDADTLRGELLGRSSPGGASPQPQVTLAPDVGVDSSNLWRAATTLLEEGSTTPRLRVALFALLASIPEARTGTAEDPVGRDADTVSLSFGQYYGGEPQTLYFDTDTHLFMASTGGDVGTLIVTDGGTVDSVSDTTPGGETFFPGPQTGVPEH
jgi:hypothetical protein